MFSVAFLTLCLWQVATLLDVGSAIKVMAPAGSYVGSLLHTPAGQEYITFLGVPYAEPPVGELRFKPTVTKGKLDGEYDATKSKPHCVQMDYIQPTDYFVGQEDCLYLNIYSPPFKQGEKLKKILVFIHGGGNLNGFQDFYNPMSLVAQHDIMVITLNYRLGVLGFMSTNSTAAMGNFGLWDQVMALRWIQENIEAFGGDPKGVTVSGESAGSIDTTVLTLSPHSKGLFLRAFAMSGSIGADHPLTSGNPVPTAVLVARRENCLLDNAPAPTSAEEWSDVVECLREVPAENFANLEGLGAMPSMMPVVDGNFLPDHIHKLFADSDYLDSIDFHNRDYLFSLLYNEGDIFRAMLDGQRSRMPQKQLDAMPVNAMWHGTISALLHTLFGPVSQEVVEKVATFYENEYDPYISSIMHPVNPVSDFAADAFFHFPAYEFLSAMSEAVGDESRVHLLHFVHFPEFLAGHYKGIAHVVDLVYLFDIEAGEINKIVDYKIDSSRWTQEDSDLRTNYRKLVAKFVKTGKTSVPVGDSELEWPWYTPGDGHYLEFSSRPSIGRYLKQDRMQFFQKTIPAWIKEFPYTDPQEQSHIHVTDEL